MLQSDGELINSFEFEEELEMMMLIARLRTLTLPNFF
jgi:hypothetical protein